jgi:hypothetical protein
MTSAVDGGDWSASVVSARELLVSIVSGYRLDDRAIEVRSPAEAKGIFL